MDNNLPLHVCAVCGMYCGKGQMDELQSSNVDFASQMSVLRRDGPRTSKLPRPGLTVTRIDGTNKVCYPMLSHHMHNFRVGVSSHLIQYLYIVDCWPSRNDHLAYAT